MVNSGPNRWGPRSQLGPLFRKDLYSGKKISDKGGKLGCKECMDRAETSNIVAK